MRFGRERNVFIFKAKFLCPRANYSVTYDNKIDMQRYTDQKNCLVATRTLSPFREDNKACIEIVWTTVHLMHWYDVRQEGIIDINRGCIFPFC